MSQRFVVTWFLVFLAVAVAFVWGTSDALPQLMASHFSPQGDADGFMPRSGYVVFIIVLLLGIPLLLAFLPFALARMDVKNINLPNGHYWLAPERREETFAFLRLHFISFASVLVVFLTYVHWLVVQANKHQPPQLSTPAIITGLVVFTAALVVWLIILYRRFSKGA
jgi:uncharacterized membrane protein